MRFIMMVVLPSGHPSELGELPSPELVGEMTKFNEEMAKAGVMLGGEGLQPSSKGARVETRGGKKVVIDGPYPETKELLGGWWIIKVDSKEEAVEWAKRVPIDNEVIELRQIFDMSDFPPETQAAAESDILRELVEKQGS